METKGELKYDDKRWLAFIVLLSVAVVGVVALLIFNAQHLTKAHPGIYTLPRLNAFLNGSVAVLLTAGYFFIRNKNMPAHRFCMLTAFVFSVLFLVSYVTYHANAPETRFGDLNHDQILSEAEKLQAGGLRYFYYILLSTHIILATVIVPIALLTVFRIWKADVFRHRKIARWTLPIWLYVSISGVLVYLLISPYYPV